MISIHVLREEGDRVRVAGEFPRQEFLSTPSARRATLSNRLWLGRLFISIHALREEGDVNLRPRRALIGNFYPRPPRGGRPTNFLLYLISSRFLSTPSARRATILRGGNV